MRVDWFPLSLHPSRRRATSWGVLGLLIPARSCHSHRPGCPAHLGQGFLTFVSRVLVVLATGLRFFSLLVPVWGHTMSMC